MEKITRYNLYSEHLQRKFGYRVYKIPVNLPGTCPNRDGKLGRGGCIFCDEQGSGFECLPNTIPVSRQIEANKEFFKKRFKAQKYIVYFQAYTNTYMPLGVFEKNIRDAAESEDIVGISISTRPDCINDGYLDFLRQYKESGLDINIELGLQTVNYHTLLKVNRGHTLAEFIDAVLRIKNRGYEICAHLILNFPWDNMTDVVENAKILSALGVHYVKLHSLYIVRGTVLGDMYLNKEISLISQDDYVRRVVTFLEHLSPEIVIQRLVGKGPKEKVIFSNWGSSWWQIKKQIENHLEDADTCQGRHYNYLNGDKALRNLSGGKYL